MIRTIFGFLLLLIPGYLLTETFFKKSDILEKILYNAMFSISFSIVVGMILGFNEFTFNVTGGFDNLFYAYYIGIFALALVYFWKLRKEKQITKKIHKKKK